jgi:thioredoxin-related protein
MKKILFLILVVLLFVSGCKKEEVQQPTSCEQQGYIKVEDANKVVDVTNKLVDLVNLCLAEKNVTGLKYLDYWKKPSS